ncbi:VOC family protein [Hahella sp. NBU794]|uniref:VOC family protein n=1 Tax=Hahella sp. NBU794 TaxID=3422590 RepID=UPI003D6E2A50
MITPTAILIHVNDIEAGLAWYKKAFPSARERCVDGFRYLDVEGFHIEIVWADAKVPAGKAGTVLYWSVGNLADEIERFLALGSMVYRGPMQIENGLGMCQVTDPFGNLIGLRGPYSAS